MGRIILAHLLTCLVALGVRASLPVKITQDAFLTSNDTNEIPDMIMSPVKVDQKPRYRLSDHVIPSSYKLDLVTYVGVPNLKEEEQSKFSGTVEIEFDITGTSEDLPIILHRENLTVSDCTLFGQSGNLGCRPILPGQPEYEEGFLTIKNKYPAGPYTLTVNFQGSLSTDMQGFYRSSYKDKNGNSVLLATTQFEPLGARRAFPCFDEPWMKASFDIKITHYEKYVAISNAPIDRTTEADKNGMKTTYFKTTPKMSTYLLAFVISDFKETKNNDGFTSIWAKESASETTKYAVDVSAKLLDALNKYTKHNFSDNIKKMHHVAIPDFKAGAMENWGLITYREKSLLYDAQSSTTSEKQNIIETIAHELAHQWFGDLVTLKWWDYTWLNEGFANFFQSYVTEMVEPGWRNVEQSVIKSIQSTAFDFDSANGTHPLNMKVQTPNEIATKFDTISYQKGGAVIRMMQHFLTKDVFQEGLQKYLNDHKLNSTESKDLFQSLQQVAADKKVPLDKKTVSEIMEAWVEKAGYPVIRLTRTYDNSTKKVKIEQKRFFTFNASDVSEEDKNTIWYIPINYATPSSMNFNDTKPQRWMSGMTDEFDIEASGEDWIILNKQQTGYYRVAYDEKNWELIANYLNSADDAWKKIHVLNRAQLINDAFAFAKLDQLSLPILLNLTAYLKNETDFIAWYPAFKVISWLDERLVNTELYHEFKEYYLKNLETMVNSVGLEESESEKDFDKLSRIPALKWACQLGHSNCTSKMNEKLVGWLKDSSSTKISADLREITLCNGMRNADEETWKKALNITLQAKDKQADETKHLINALACSHNETILKNYLHAATDLNATHDFLAVLKDVSHNSPTGVNVSLDYLLNQSTRVTLKLLNLDKLHEAFKIVAERITNKAQLDKLMHGEDHQIPANITSEAVSVALKRVDWYESKNETLKDWVKTLHPSQSSGVSAISSFTILVFSVFTLVLNFS